MEPGPIGPGPIGPGPIGPGPMPDIPLGRGTPAGDMIPPGFICVILSGTELLMIRFACQALTGGAKDEYGGAMPTGVPYGPSRPGTTGGPKLRP